MNFAIAMLGCVDLPGLGSLLSYYLLQRPLWPALFVLNHSLLVGHSIFPTSWFSTYVRHSLLYCVRILSLTSCGVWGWNPGPWACGHPLNCLSILSFLLVGYWHHKVRGFVCSPFLPRNHPQEALTTHQRKRKAPLVQTHFILRVPMRSPAMKERGELGIFKNLRKSSTHKH